MVKVMKVIEVDLYNRLMNLMKDKRIIDRQNHQVNTVNYDEIFKNAINDVQKGYKIKKKKKKIHSSPSNVDNVG